MTLTIATLVTLALIVLFTQIGFGMVSYNNENSFDGFGFTALSDAVLNSEANRQMQNSIKRLITIRGSITSEMALVTNIATAQASTVRAGSIIQLCLLPYNVTRWAMHKLNLRENSPTAQTASQELS